jgi:nitrite reductase/ring-hydroxylating ferredoxin subunit
MYRWIFLLLIFIFSCKKDTIDSSIPFRQVNLLIYPNDPAYFDISSPGGHVYINGGYNGIIIYRFNQEEFRVFDRACPYDPLETCARVHFDSQGDVLVKDTCCLSRFQVIDGSVVSGPAAQPLKPYNHSYDGNVLHIYN